MRPSCAGIGKIMDLDIMKVIVLGKTYDEVFSISRPSVLVITTGRCTENRSYLELMLSGGSFRGGAKYSSLRKQNKRWRTT